MPSFRVSALPFCATALFAAAVLTGCASSRLAAEPPAGVRLAGDWKLDPGESDDLGRAIAQLRAQASRARHSRRSEQAAETSGGPEGSASGRRRVRRGGAGGPQQGQTGGDEGASGPGGAGEDVGPGATRGSAVGLLMSNVPKGDYLRISVSPGSVTVTSGGSSDQYTPGLESDISAEQGDARQISGWKDGAFVIETRPQFGPETTQTYGVTKDGKLMMTLRLAGGRTKFTFTRVYERTTSLAPLAPPTNN